MKKFSLNSSCPCGSTIKYKKCCLPYHKGARAKDALVLMKSRYCAYATGQSRYIIETTHPENPDYTDDLMAWREEIDYFCKNTDFLGLEILEVNMGNRESSITFRAKLSSGDMVEKSTFVLDKERWFYLGGEIRKF